jgi:LmbE family N-acetylglucosaminyl deacetylase
MLGLTAPLERVAVLGAHCDDIAIGAGGTLLSLCEANPGLRVDALVLSGGGTAREAEERAALAEFTAGAKLDLTVLDLPDGSVPTHWERVKRALRELRQRIDPDLLFAPQAADAHQDHRTLAHIVPQVFRDHLTLGYEILKWESDLAQPTVYQPLSVRIANRKTDLLCSHYASQHGRSWYDRETFLGLARVRGVQCHARYAEAFHSNKLVLDLTGG